LHCPPACECAATYRQLPAELIAAPAVHVLSSHPLRPPPAPPLFPYTTLFRSSEVQRGTRRHIEAAVADAPAAKRQGARIDIDHAGDKDAAGVVERDRDVCRARAGAALGVGAGVVEGGDRTTESVVDRGVKCGL